MAMEQIAEPEFETEYDALDSFFQDDEAPARVPEAGVYHDAQAEAHLRALRYWRTCRTEAEAHAEAEMYRIKTWLDAETSRIDRRIQWHEGGLRAFLEQTGKKTVKLIYGTLKRIAGRARVDCTDFLAFKRWNDLNDVALVRVKMEPDKKAITTYIKETGEIPDGCDLVTGEDTFKIVTD